MILLWNLTRIWLLTAFGHRCRFLRQRELVRQHGAPFFLTLCEGLGFPGSLLTSPCKTKLSFTLPLSQALADIFCPAQTFPMPRPNRSYAALFRFQEAY